jgi:hypothetical protein
VHTSLIIYKTEAVVMPTLQREIKHKSNPLYSAFCLSFKGLLGYINHLEITISLSYFVYDAASVPPPPHSHAKNIGQ